MQTHTQVFQEHADDYGWSVKEQRDILLEIIESELKWNIFGGYLWDNYPLTLEEDLNWAPPNPEKTALMDQAACLLVFSEDETFLTTHYLPTTIPEVIAKTKEKFGGGDYLLRIGDKDGKLLLMSDKTPVMSKKVTI